MICGEIYSIQRSSWSWLYGSWIYNYLCNQCLSPLTLWGWIPLKRGVLDTTLCDKVCQWLAAGQRFSPGTPVSSTNKTDHHDVAEILLKVALNTIKQTNIKKFLVLIYLHITFIILLFYYISLTWMNNIYIIYLCIIFICEMLYITWLFYMNITLNM